MSNHITPERVPGYGDELPICEHTCNGRMLDLASTVLPFDTSTGGA